MKFEGGFVDHPRDPGGATKFGITLNTLKVWRNKPVTSEHVKKLELIEAKKIYRKKYWDIVKGDDICIGIDLLIFDFSIHSGAKRAVCALQNALKVAIDGRIGPQTLSAVNNTDPLKLAQELCLQRSAFLKRLPIFRVFGRGWSKRVTEVRKRAIRLIMKHKTTLIP